MEPSDKRIVLIVEGINDDKQIKSAMNDTYNVKTLVTNGMKVDRIIIDKIQSLIDDGYEPYILSDPDEAGNTLCDMINKYFPNIKRINVDANECGYKAGKRIKVGVEYSSFDYLRSVIYPLIDVEYKKKSHPVCWD